MDLVQLIKDEAVRRPIFLQRSNTRSFALEVDDSLTIFVNPNRLSTSNAKLKDILIFDTPAGKGFCHNCKSCEKDCYAKAQQVFYPTVPMYRYVNLFLVEKRPGLLMGLIDRQLSAMRKRITVCRIHSSGDFYSQHEVAFWDRFIHNHPELTFYAYTKVEELFDFSCIENNGNFNLIRSMIAHEGKCYRNFGSLEYVQRIATLTGGYLCPATMKETKGTVKCNRDCHYCLTGNKPIFLIHGQGRNVVNRKGVEK